MYDFKICDQVVLLERSQSETQKLRMKLLGMKKDMKLNHSVSSPPTKYGGTFFVKDLLQNVNTTNRGWNLKDTLCKLFPWGWGFHVNSVFFFKNILVVTYSLMSWGSFRFTYL